MAEDGELLFRGGQVFAGYWENEPATAEVLRRDGWFHTGDVGEIDEEGFVRITGRKKEILVTAGGKNVAPAVLEDRVRAHALVSQCLVVGPRHRLPHRLRGRARPVAWYRREDGPGRRIQTCGCVWEKGVSDRNRSLLSGSNGASANYRLGFSSHLRACGISFA